MVIKYHCVEMNQEGKQHLILKKNEAFVKENRHLSREHVTVFTQIASNGNAQLAPEFALANNHRSSRHLQEHTINGLTKVHTV